MRHMYSHPGEYRKIFLANYLCIGFVPRGIPSKTQRLVLIELAFVVPQFESGDWRSFMQHSFSMELWNG